MDQGLCRVWRVQPSPVTGGTEWVIDASLVANRRSIQVSTLNAWLASLCQRARDEHLPIVLYHEKTRFGPTLRRAHFLEKAVSA